MTLFLDFLKRNKLYFYAFVIIALLVIHGIFDNLFKIDNLTLIMLLALFVLPYIPSITTWKFKYGDFETVISAREIDALEKKADQIAPDEETIEDEDTLGLKGLARTDPQLALAKIRIELEKQLTMLSTTYMPENQGKRPGLFTIIKTLAKKDIIEPNLATVLQTIIDIANRAVHGEDISPEDTIRLIDTYNKASSELDEVITSHILKTLKKEEIDQNVSKMYNNAEYTLITIVPTMPQAYKNTYRVNQTELNAFLTGYDEHAEYVVEIKKLEKPGDGSSP